MPTLRQACLTKRYDISQDDLPLTCPLPNHRVWDAHPRVALALDAEGHACCPYCGAEYFLSKR